MFTMAMLVEALRQLLPEASIDTDLDGQVVIYTNLFDMGDGVLASIDLLTVEEVDGEPLP
jgi:hypothetical protein